MIELKLTTIRGRKINVSQKARERSEWDAKVGALGAPLSHEEIFNLLRSFLFFYTPPQDYSRLDRVAVLLLQHIKVFSALPAESRSSSSSSSSYSENSATTARWVHQVKRLLSHSQQRILHSTTPLEFPILYTHLQLSLQLTDYPLYQQFSSDTTRSQVLYERVTVHSVVKGLYTVLRYLLLHMRETPQWAAEQSRLWNCVIALALRPLRFHALSPTDSRSLSHTRASQEEAIHKSFVNNILSIPFLLYRNIPQEPLQALLTVLPMVLSCDPQSLSLPEEQTESLLGNLCSLLKPLLQSLTLSKYLPAAQSTLTPYMRFLAALVQLTPKTLFAEHSGRDPQLEEQLKTLLESTTVAPLFSVFLPSTLPSASTTAELPSGLFHLCTLYTTLYSRWKDPLNMTLLSTITYNTSVVPTLWRVVANTAELQKLATDSVGSAEESTGLKTALMLFARCYVHHLLTMDDREFFEQQLYFTLKDLVSMINTLKRVVFKMFWSKEFKLKDPFRESLTSLLQQLYDRNSRHSFCPEQYWVTEETQSINFSHKDERFKQVLQLIPFVVPFAQRVKAFYDVIEEDHREYQEHPLESVNVRIRRDYVFDDGFAQLNALILSIVPALTDSAIDSQLKGRIRVELISRNGLPEAGIDGGGVFKEFLTELMKTAYRPDYGLFKTTSQNDLYPNPDSTSIVSDALRQLEFLGKMLAKCIYENILVELPFANFFLAKLLGKFNYINDLVFLDPELHKNLVYLKTASNVEDLCLTFTLIENEFGEQKLVELVPGGKDIAVTDENKLRYISLMANYKLNTQIKQQSAAFQQGFSQLISPELLRMFNQQELQTIISGNPGGIAMDDLKKHTNYSGGYSEDHPVIQRFWRVLQSFTPQQQQDFLRFCTSCSKPPLLGFSYLQPPFCIHRAVHTGGSPDEYLPTSSTCMNFFKLPSYTSDAKMREKILYAISSGAGFELS